MSYRITRFKDGRVNIRATGKDAQTLFDAMKKKYSQPGNSAHSLKELSMNQATATKPQARHLHVIADEIRKDWKKPYFGAVPYLDAMSDLHTIDDNFGEDSAKSIVLYFLANAQTWKGETAKRVKVELKKIAGIK